MRGIKRYFEDLLRSRRPRAFRAGPDEAALARTAIILRSARPGSGAPTEEFVTGLHKRLAAELNDARQSRLPCATRAVPSCGPRHWRPPRPPRPPRAPGWTTCSTRP